MGTKIVDNVVLDTDTGEIIIDLDGSPYAEEHLNFTETVGRYTYYLRAKRFLKCSEIMTACRNYANNLMDRVEAGETVDPVIIGIRATLVNELRDLRNQQSRMVQLQKQLRDITQAQKGMIGCYAKNGCNGVGTITTLNADGTVDKKNCGLCNGTGVVEHTAEANNVLERFATKHSGSINAAIDAIVDEYNANIFSPNYIRAHEAEIREEVERRRALRAAAGYRPDAVDGAAGDDIPF